MPCQQEDLSPILGTHTKTLGKVTGRHNHVAGKGEIGGSLEFDGQQTLLGEFQAREIISENKVGDACGTPQRMISSVCSYMCSPLYM